MAFARPPYTMTKKAGGSVQKHRVEHINIVQAPEPKVALAKDLKKLRKNLSEKVPPPPLPRLPPPPSNPNPASSAPSTFSPAASAAPATLPSVHHLHNNIFQPFTPPIHLPASLPPCFPLSLPTPTLLFSHPSMGKRRTCRVQGPQVVHLGALTPLSSHLSLGPSYPSVLCNHAPWPHAEPLAHRCCTPWRVLNPNKPPNP